MLKKDFYRMNLYLISQVFYYRIFQSKNNEFSKRVIYTWPPIFNRNRKYKKMSITWRFIRLKTIHPENQIHNVFYSSIYQWVSVCIICFICISYFIKFKISFHQVTLDVSTQFAVFLSLYCHSDRLINYLFE
jgi:hypothetical protein